MCCFEILIIFHRSSNLLICKQPIKTVDQQKNRGVLVKDYLTWSDHINSIYAKA